MSPYCAASPCAAGFTELEAWDSDPGNAGGGGGAGCAIGAAGTALCASSEVQVSTTHFQLPSACFLQNSSSLPRSDKGMPCESPKRSSYAPVKYAASPDRV